MPDKYSYLIKTAFVSALIVSMLCTMNINAQAEEPFEIFFVEPFTTRLPENSTPPDLLPHTFPDPIRVSLTPGECGSPAVIAIRGKTDLGTVTISPAFREHEIDRSEIQAGVRLIKMIGRNTRWIHEVHQSTPTRDGLVLVPDILVYDERAFNRQLRTASGRLPMSISTKKKVAAEIGPNQTRYFLLTVRVPQGTAAGTYKAQLKMSTSSGQQQIDIPIQISVLNFELPPPGKILAISNDFGNPSDRHYRISLQDMVDHGMNSTRLRSVLSRSDRQKVLRDLKRMGIETVIHDDTPRNSQDTAASADSPVQYFYGIDEPIPKRRSGNSWQKMADHVNRSNKIHRLSGKVATSLPFSVAIELTKPDGELYRTLQNHGIHNLYEPLDFANYTLAIQHLERQRRGGDRPGPARTAGRDRPRDRRPPRQRPMPQSSIDGYQLPRTNNDLWLYIAELQADYTAGSFDEAGRPASKNDWVETYYFALGFFRSPFFARLMYGYYLFNSHLDGITTWTQYRPRANPFTDRDGPDAVIAYPAADAMLSTFSWEAVREGTNDLRYCRAAEAMILSLKGRHPEKYQAYFDRFIAILSAYSNLMVSDVRIDKAYASDTFRKTRTELILLIQDLLKVTPEGQ